MRRRLAIAAAGMAVAGAMVPEAAPAAANRAPNQAVLVSPVDGRRFEHGEPQTFTLTALDEDGDPYTGTVTVRNRTTGAVVRTLAGTPAPSGDISRAVALPPLPEGVYAWTAYASDALGAAGAVSASRAFDVGRPMVAGAGALHGGVSYDAPGIPGGSCVATRFEIGAESQAAVVDAAFVGFVGRVDFAATGSSACEDRLMGSGPLNGSVTGSGITGGTLACPSLSGEFDRFGPAWTADLQGECTVNGFPAGPTRWHLSAEAVPPPGDLAAPGVRSTTFDGGFTVRSLRQQ